MAAVTNGMQEVDAKAQDPAKILLEKLGGQSALDIIAKSALTFLGAAPEKRAKLRAEIDTLELNDHAKAYLRDRYDDIDPESKD